MVEEEKLKCFRGQGQDRLGRDMGEDELVNDVTVY